MYWFLRVWSVLAMLVLSAALRANLQRHHHRRWLSACNGDEHFMRLALRHAQFAFREKEVPVGAVLVDGEGRVVAAGRNGVEQQKDATAHAEISVLRKAAKLIGNWRLQDCTLYTTLEPCAMCFSAAQGFRVKRVVYGAKDTRLGALGSWINLSEKAHPFHTIEVTSGVLEEESGTLLKRFFQLRRREKSSASSKVGEEEEL
jgi:tRNA(adenine34) deaminase